MQAVLKSDGENKTQTTGRGRGLRGGFESAHLESDAVEQQPEGGRQRHTDMGVDPTLNGF